MGAGWMLLAVTFLAGPGYAIPGATPFAIALCVCGGFCFTALHHRNSVQRPRPERARKPVLGI